MCAGVLMFEYGAVRWATLVSAWARLRREDIWELRLGDKHGVVPDP
jgi:hypothetical protein